MAQLALSPAATAEWSAAHGHLFHSPTARDVNSDIGEEIAGPLFALRDVRRNLANEINGLWSPANTPTAARRQLGEERLAEYGLDSDDDEEARVIPPTPAPNSPAADPANARTPTTLVRREPSGDIVAPAERVSVAPNLEQRVPSNPTPLSQYLNGVTSKMARGDGRIAAHSNRVDHIFLHYDASNKSQELHDHLVMAEVVLAFTDDALNARPHCVCSTELLEMSGAPRNVGAETVVHYAALGSAFWRRVSVVHFDEPCVCASCGQNATNQQYLVYHANGLALRVDLCGMCALPFPLAL